MVRIFIKKEWISGNEVFLPEAEKHYILNVMRMKEGDELFLFDSDANEYRGKIIRKWKKDVRIFVFDRVFLNKESQREIALIQSILKGERMDLIVQKGCELGVHSIYPVVSKRTIPRYSQEKSNQRRERWQKIATEAAEQCGRVKIPVIEEILTLYETIEKIPSSFKIRILLSELTRELGLKDFLRSSQGDPKNGVALIVGPEGGFTEDEVQMARKGGFIPVSLGKRILRSETASIVALSIIQYELGDLGSI